MTKQVARFLNDRDQLCGIVFVDGSKFTAVPVGHYANGRPLPCTYATFSESSQYAEVIKKSQRQGNESLIWFEPITA